MTDAAVNRPAVLFDIDGTLVDSNYLHVQAWSETFDRVGRPVDSWRIHRAIGMDSAKLLAELLGSRAEELGDEAKKIHAKRYKKLTSRLRAFESTRELLDRVSAAGLQVVLATSAPEEELKHLREVLDSESVIDQVTSAEDVEQAKPDPDIVRVGLDKAGITADQAVMVGDTIWDGRACAEAGVAFVGVLSGGVSAAELREAGAVAVYAGPADLLDQFDQSPLAALIAPR